MAVVVDWDRVRAIWTASGRTSATIARYMYWARRFVAFCALHGIDPVAHLTPEVVERCVAHPVRPRRRRRAGPCPHRPGGAHFPAGSPGPGAAGLREEQPETGERRRDDGGFTVGRARRAIRLPPDRPAEWSRVVSAEMMRKLGAAVEFPLAPRGGAPTPTLPPLREEVRAVPLVRAARLPVLQRGVLGGGAGEEPSGRAPALS